MARGVTKLATHTLGVTSNAVDAAALPASRIEAMRAELRTLGQAEMQRATMARLLAN